MLLKKRLSVTADGRGKPSDPALRSMSGLVMVIYPVSCIVTSIGGTAPGLGKASWVGAMHTEARGDGIAVGRS